nr:hypothetical protein Iba_chr10dCG10200 [Ipomoea batatas]
MSCVSLTLFNCSNTSESSRLDIESNTTGSTSLVSAKGWLEILLYNSFDTCTSTPTSSTRMGLLEAKNSLASDVVVMFLIRDLGVFELISSEFQRYLVIEFCSRRVELCMSDYPTSVAPIMKYSGLRTIPACTCLANFTRSLACTIPDECLEMSTMIEREFEFGKVLDFLESFWFAGDQRFSWYGR